VVDEDRPAGGITAIFDSQHPAVRGVNFAVHVASFCEFKLTPMSRAATDDDVGKLLPGMSSALRPHPLDELREWGGPPLVRRKRVLDLGCGDGRLALGVAPYAKRVDGIDPDPEAIAAAKRNARQAGVRNVRFAAGAAQRLPYPDKTFDVVILSWTL
jgi:SAM-dependent methyltransferase